MNYYRCQIDESPSLDLAMNLRAQECERAFHPHKRARESVRISGTYILHEIDLNSTLSQDEEHVPKSWAPGWGRDLGLLPQGHDACC